MTKFDSGRENQQEDIIVMVIRLKKRRLGGPESRGKIMQLPNVTF